MVVRGSTVRPASDREEELAEACRNDRRRISTPIPRPTSGTPHHFWVSHGPKLPSPPAHRMPINPVAPDAERVVRAAAVSARARVENEEFLRPLLEEAALAANAPIRKSPPRAADDYYDLARWSRRRWF